jgi:small subunit ribosomal protein S11
MTTTTAQTPTKKKHGKKNVPIGVAHVYSSFNNTLINITDLYGNTIVWGSAGHQGFKGAKKSTPYAAQMTAETVGKKAIECGMKTISVEVRGPGSGRESSVRALMSVGLIVSSIKDVSPVAHNGVKPPKRRRV